MSMFTEELVRFISDFFYLAEIRFQDGSIKRLAFS